jgi:hypothetical protein
MKFYGSQEQMTLTDQDTAIDAFHALKPTKFGTLESLTLKRVLDPEMWGRFDVLLRLVSSMEPLSQCLYMEFRGVREIRIGSLDDIRVKHLTLEIKSIRKNQLENLNYSVAEYEEEAFSFSCRDFTAKICDQ